MARDVEATTPGDPAIHGLRRRLGLWGAALRHGGTAACAAALDIALPRQCPACRDAIATEGVCPACWSALAFIRPPYCERLGIPFVYDPGPGILSAEAIAAPPAFHRARAALRFNDTARQLVHSLKYGDRSDLAPLFGRWMAHAGAELLAGSDLLIPVPLHWQRLWARRFNQSAALAHAGGRTAERPVATDLLRRARPTAHQTGLTREERAANVQGAFTVHAEARGRIAGRRVLLVDDVLTTGATADACARALLRAGAAQVDLLVFARVVAPADGLI